MLAVTSFRVIAQINQYDHSPVIVGQQDLYLFPGESLHLNPDDLIIGDLDQGHYNNYAVSIQPGDNYTLHGNTITPSSNFTGILYIPCRVSDGKLFSNTYLAEVIVYREKSEHPSLTETRIYLSPEGNDGSNGSINQPFATIGRAFSEVEKIKSGPGIPAGGIEIVLREGIYPIMETVELKASVSGEKGNPILIKAYPGESVVFEGGIRLDYELFHSIKTPGIKERIRDKNAAEKVVEFDLKAAGMDNLGICPRRGYGIGRRGDKGDDTQPEAALSVNGKTQIIARYPNQSYNKQIARITDPKHAFITRDRHVAGWPEARDIWIDGSLCKPWEWSMNKVESIDPQTLEIRLKYPEYSQMDSVTAIYHFKNILEEIDMPGEYYIDRENGKLYYFPSDDFGPEAELFLTGISEPMISFKEGVSDVWFDGIIFENGREGGIIMQGERNKVLNCEIRSFSTFGIIVTGQRNEINGCHIHHTGKEGIELHGWSMTDMAGRRYGDRSRVPFDRKLIPSCNQVKNTEIDHFSLWHRAYTPGMRIDGVGTGTSHCLVHHGPHMGITIHGNDHVFEYTEVHHTPEEFSDMLSMYIITGSNPQHRGTVVRRNYFHDVGNKWKQGAGVYLDNETYGVGVYENIFHRSGGDESGWSVMIHGGGDNIVRNNIFVDCVFPFMVSTRLNTYAKDRFEPYLERWSRRFAEQYPFFDTTVCAHGIRYPELKHFFEDDDGTLPEDHYSFSIEKNEEGEISNYWTRRTPSTNVFESNLVFNLDPDPFRMGEPIDGVREVREFYVVNGFRVKDGVYLDLLIHSNNHRWMHDPGFSDYDNGDLTIRNDAEVLGKIPGLDRIPFREIGLRK